VPPRSISSLCDSYCDKKGKATGLRGPLLPVLRPGKPASITKKWLRKEAVAVSIIS